jgi:serine-type D-Ala-D-Ala carboxypeptidase
MLKTHTNTTPPATTTVAMARGDRAHLAVVGPIADLIPHVTAAARDPRLGKVTVAELLTHRGGLAAWEPLYLHAAEASGALARIAALPLRSAPGRERRYSDLSMMLVAEVLSTVAGRPLDRLFADLVATPLGLASASYGPVRGDVAATSQGNPFERRMIATGDPHPVQGDPDGFEGWRHHTLVGEVNDGNAHHVFGGVAGHAGLFATAGDVAVVGQALLTGMSGGDGPWCGASTVRRFLDRPEPLGAWGNRLAAITRRDGSGDTWAGGFGHGGFTGGQLVVDVSRELVVVLLTNRQHPGEPYPSIEPLWHEVLRSCLDVFPDD